MCVFAKSIYEKEEYLVNKWLKAIILSFVFLLFAWGIQAQAKHMPVSCLTTEDGLSDDRVSYIFRDGRDNLWIGIENGLNKYNGYQVVVNKHDSRDSKTIDNNKILCIAEDTENNFLVGTKNGSSSYNANDDSFVSFPNIKDDSTSVDSNFINCLFLDKQGNFWIRDSQNEGDIRISPFSSGLFSVNLATYTDTSNDTKGGGHSATSRVNCNADLEDTNHLLLGADQEKNRYNRQKGQFKNRTFKPEDLFDLNNNGLWNLYRDRKNIFWIGIAVGVNIYNLKIPKKSLYSYKILSIDKHWNLTNAIDRFVNRDPGPYRLSVNVSNNDGEWDERYTSTPPWWRTWYAKMIAILGLVGSLLLACKQRIRTIKSRNKKLEQEVAERTSSLRRINKKLTKFKHKLNLAYEEIKLTTDALNDIAIIIKGDANGSIVEVNQMFLTTLGYEESEIIGKSREELFEFLIDSNAHPPDFFKEMYETLVMEEAWRGEVCYRAKSGNPVWLSKNVIPLRKQGTLLGYFSFSFDITLKKNYENEILEVKKVAESALTANDTFLSIMSHEIRTPLNSVIGLSNLLLKKNPRKDQKDIVMTLKNSGENLLYMINNMLDYNKIRAGKIELENLPFDLKSQLKQLQFSFQPLAVDKKLDLKITLSSNTPVRLIGDSLRLNQILYNLLNNAIKFTRKGQVKLSVSLKSSDEDNCELFFVVEDSGVGISEEKLKTVFTPFQLSENYISREFGGSGLGLSIVKDLVDLFRGSISVESNTNTGTTFTVTLPFKMGTEVLTLSETEELQANESVILEGYRILYVEDVESNQTLVRNLLNDYKVECVTAPNCEIALLHSSTKHFDVILMNLQIPGISGYETADAIRNQKKGKNHQTPIIAFTAESYSEPLKNKVMDQGMQELLTKPFRFEQLIEKIRKVCPHRTTKDEFLSFQFYEWAFNYDRKQLNDFRELMIKDFKKFEMAVHDHWYKKDLPAIRSEIHKMSPIVQNLQCHSLIELFELYRQHEKYNSHIDGLNNKLDGELEKLFSFLENLNY